MTISSTDRTAGPFITNGSTTDFPFTFKVFSRSDVLVKQVLIASPGTITTLTLDSDYTVTLNDNQNNDPGGTVTIDPAIATGYQILVTSDIDALQPADLRNQGAFFPSVITDALDRLTIIAQQLIEKVNLSLRFPVGETGSGELPSKVSRAGRVLSFDDDGLPEAGPTIPDIEVVASLSSEIAAVAAIAESDLLDVAAISSEIVTVAAISADIQTVASNASTIVNIADDIVTVSGISGNVTAVANNETNIQTIVDNLADIQTVAPTLTMTAVEMTLNVSSNPEVEGSNYNTIKDAYDYAVTKVQAGGTLTLNVAAETINETSQFRVDSRMKVIIDGAGAGSSTISTTSSLYFSNASVEIRDVTIAGSQSFTILADENSSLLFVNSSISNNNDFGSALWLSQSKASALTGTFSGGKTALYLDMQSEFTAGTMSGAATVLTLNTSSAFTQNVVYLEGMSKAYFNGLAINPASNASTATGVMALSNSTVCIFGTVTDNGNVDTLYNPAADTYGNNYSRIITT